MEFLKLSAYLQSKFGSNYKSVIYKSVKFYNQNLLLYHGTLSKFPVVVYDHRVFYKLDHKNNSPTFN